MGNGQKTTESSEITMTITLTRTNISEYGGGGRGVTMTLLELGAYYCVLFSSTGVRLA